MSLQSRSQRQAQAVYHCVIKRQSEADKLGSAGAKQSTEDYERWCQRFPTLVLQNGLLQTLAFIQTKAAADSEIASKWFLQDFNTARNQSLKSTQQPAPVAGVAVVRRPNNPNAGMVENNSFESITKLIEYIQKSPVNRYQQETRLALELSLWFKRYAKSVLANEESN